MTSDDKAAPPEGGPGAGPTPPSEEAKARFREALERTHAARQRHNEGQRNTGSVRATGTTGPSQRMFRRKSGG